MELNEIEESAWAQLVADARNPVASFRYVTLCSVDEQLRPQARTVVLRAVDRATRLLEFHTDVRSPKWLELSTNANASVLGYCATSRTQLRMVGEVALLGPETEEAAKAWNALSFWTQSTYAGGPPGDERALGAPDSLGVASEKDVAEGRNRFGVVRFRTNCLDWFRLQRQNNKRALFDYDKDGALTSARWINP